MTLTKSLAAGISFSAVLAAAIWTILIHLDASGGSKLLEKTCPPSVVKTFGQRYGTGLEPVDSLLCGMVTFFQASLEDPVKDLLTVFILSGPPVSFILLLESSRSDRPFVASFPLLFGFIMQLFTGGVAASLFWTLFTIQACYGGTRQGRKPVSRAAVEAALLAVLIGYVAPSVWMLATRDVLAIVVWQPWPLYMSIVQNTWMFIRRSKQSEPGVDLAQIVLMVLSLFGTGVWLYTLWPHFSLYAAFDLLNWVPSWSIPSLEATTISSAALHLLQYDMFWMFVSTVMAAIFLLQDMKEVLLVVQIAPGMAALLGPAALVGGLWIFREGELVAQDPQASKAIKSE